MVGLVSAFRHFSKRLIALLISAVLQILLVIIADLVKGYWFAYRQLLFLHPFTLLLSSLGFCSIRKNFEKIPFVALISLLILASLFSLQDYFQWSKSAARQISEYIIANWTPANDLILIIPGYQEKVYRFYLHYIFQRPDIAARIRPVEIHQLHEQALSGGTFLIVIENLSEHRVSQFLQLGFSPVKISMVWLGHSLFIRARSVE